MSAQSKSIETRVKAMVALYKNSMSWYVTAKEVGVSYPTLRKWYDNFGKEMIAEYIESKEDVDKVITLRKKLASQQQTKIESKKDVLEQLKEVREEAIKKISDLLKKETNIKFTANALQVIHDVYKDVKEESTGEGTPLPEGHEELGHYFAFGGKLKKKNNEKN